MLRKNIYVSHQKVKCSYVSFGQDRLSQTIVKNISVIARLNVNVLTALLLPRTQLKVFFNHIIGADQIE